MKRYLPGIGVIILLTLLLGLASCMSNYTEKDVLITPGQFDIPPAFHGNPWAPGGANNAASCYVHEPLFVYVPTTKEYIQRLGESFEESPDHKTLTVHLKKNAYWHDNTPFTSKDVRTTFFIGYLKSMEIWWTLQDIKCPDDYTVVFEFHTVSPLNTIRALTERVTSPYHIFGRWSDRIPELRKERAAIEKGDISKEAAMKQIENDVREVLFKFHPDIPIGTGPFRVTSVSASDIVMTKFDRHYEAENVKFKKVRIVRWSSNEVVWSYLMAGEVDCATPATPYDVAMQIIKKNPGMDLTTPSDMSDYGLIYNCGRAPNSDLKFRQAVAHIINRDQIRQVAYTFADTDDKYSLGVPKSFEHVWFDDEYYKSLTVYDCDHEKARKILREAGYIYNDQSKQWMMPDRKPISLEIIAPVGLSDLILLAEASAAQLTKFGIKAQVRTVPQDLYLAIVSGGKYDMAAENGAQMTKYGHPSISYNRFYRGENLLNKTSAGLLKKTSCLPDEVRYKDGAMINTAKLAEELNSCMDENREKEIVRQLAWVTNENLPYLAVYEKKVVIFTYNGKRVDKFPPKEDSYWGAAPGSVEVLYATLIVKGKIVPMK